MEPEFSIGSHSGRLSFRILWASIDSIMTMTGSFSDQKEDHRKYLNLTMAKLQNCLVYVGVIS